MTGALILVVEDDARSRKLVRDLLEHAGYRVIEATTGDAAVRLAKEMLPALIVMDVRLPGLDGIAALQQIRADTAIGAVPVLAVTASAMPRDRSKIGAAGFDGYHEKPIDVHRFLVAVRELLAVGPGAAREDA
jgi:two-component system cell cycle response regulator DivK